jgi:hypothetical protein
MAKHEFGIMDSFDENIWYNVYEPEKYDCISVSDDIIEMLLDQYHTEFMEIKTYFQIATQKGVGLDYCGVTIIPPESLNRFRDVVIKANSRFKSKELQYLIDKITEGIVKNKHVIHEYSEVAEPPNLLR